MKAVPPGLKLAFPVDTTNFVRISIHDVIMTLFEAIGLVVAVMFLFLQNWRTTLIPAITIPVVLLGTFGVLAAFGYTINTLTMFALVLAIGLLVDDAIVVVENVERIMSEEGLGPHDATVKSMGEITSALIGIALVLSAVFLPMAFFGGSTGVIYRQFSITIVSAMVLSILVALVLTPTLCATLLAPVDEGRRDIFTAASSPGSTPASSAPCRLPPLPAMRVLDRPGKPIILYVLIVARARLSFPAPADRLPAGGGPGVHHRPVHAAGRRGAVAHARRGQADRALLPRRRKEQCREHVHRHSASASPAPVRMPAWPSSS